MLKVLYIDHSKLFRNAMGKVIDECGHAFRSAECLEAGKEILKTDTVDLIIMGLEFQDGDATEFISSLLSDPKTSIPVIVMSSNDSVTKRQQLFALGIFDFILKSDIQPERFSRYFRMIIQSEETKDYLMGLRIAVLDDSPLLIAFLKRIFQLNGLSGGRFFMDPEEFLSCRDQFDLYVIDFILPGISGDAVIETIRERYPGSIIIGMSAIKTDRALSNSLMAGADDYLHKPFDAELFMARLKINVKSYQLNVKLKKAAITDGLTGAFNHAYSFQELDTLLKECDTRDCPLSVMMMDVDDFKRVNDGFGHQAGDEILISISNAVRSAKRNQDVFGRYGGEEFIVIMPDTDAATAKNEAERVRVSVETMRLSVGLPMVTVSIGTSTHEKGERTEDIIARADKNLYAAKHGGKNRIVG